MVMVKAVIPRQEELQYSLLDQRFKTVVQSNTSNYRADPANLNYSDKLLKLQISSEARAFHSLSETSLWNLADNYYGLGLLAR